MNSKQEESKKRRTLQKHELITLIAVFIAGILLGSFVIAGPRLQVQCNDGIDNDGDTKTDYPNDPGCSSKRDKSERGSIACDDGIDNDGDAKTDYPNDPGCSSPSDNSEADTANSCSDTDGGFVIGVQGTVSGYNNNQPYSYAEYCLDSNTLVEYYCSGVYPVSYYQNCNPTNSTNVTNSCINGACV